MALKEWIDCLKIYLGGTDNSIIFASILSFLATLLLVVVTAIYVRYVSRSSRFSESYSKFKLTDDLGKESEHEITDSMLKLSELYGKYKAIDKRYEDFDEVDKLISDYHTIRITDYFNRVYLNYKHNKVDKKIFLEQLSRVVVSYKDTVDFLVEEIDYDREVLERRNFNELYKICKNYLDKIN